VEVKALPRHQVVEKVVNNKKAVPDRSIDLSQYKEKVATTPEPSFNRDSAEYKIDVNQRTLTDPGTDQTPPKEANPD